MLSIYTILFVTMIIVLYWLAKYYCQMIFADYPYNKILPKYMAVMLAYLPVANIGILVLDMLCRCLISLVVDLRTIWAAIYIGIQYIVKLARR